MGVDLLRFSDLAQYGVSNWPTLKRWIQKEGFPPGFYLAANTRVWHQSAVDAWLSSRPAVEVDPPEITKPGPSVAAEEAGPLNALVGNQSKSNLTAEPMDTQLFNGGA